MKNLLEIGHYCATGGISVHLRRLVKLLQNDYNINIIDESPLTDNNGKVFNIRNKQFFKYLKLVLKSDIIHIHTTIQILRFFHVIIGFILFKKVVVTIHSLTVVNNKKDMLFLRFTLLFSNKIIVVSEEVKQKLEIKKAIILPAFLPPIMEEEEKLNKEITTLLELNKGRKIIVSNAYKLNIYNGQDLYGLDLLINVACKIKKDKKNIKIIL